MRNALQLLAVCFGVAMGGVLVACGQSTPSPESGAVVAELAAPGAPGATPADATRLGALRADDMPSGFALVDRPLAFEFPRDHGPHPTFRHEWWYVTGHLDAATGERFGFELTFFRFALAPPVAPAILGDSDESASNAVLPSSATPTWSATASASTTPSAWRSRQIYMAHFAVTDLNRKQFHSTERFARDALGMAGAEAAPFHVWLDDWSLGAPPNEAGAASTPVWQLRAADEHYSFELQLRPETPPVLNGNAGLSQKSGAAGAASYYYSMPRLAALGRVVRDGKPLEVQGLAWLDREWGSGSLGADQQGWDWFALQLDDGGTLMFYSLRKLDGTRDVHSAGTWFAPDGTTHALANQDVQIEVKDFWNSPRGGRYPARWQLRVPSIALDVDIQPRLADQELDTNPRYWEGAAIVTGTRAAVPATGKAYVELVGYAGARSD